MARPVVNSTPATIHTMLRVPSQEISQNPVHAQYEAGQQEDSGRVDNDPWQQRQPERLADDEIRDHENQQTGDAAGDEDDAERARRGLPVGDHASEIVAHRHARKHDADDAGPGVQRDADIRCHDAASDQLDDEGAGTGNEDERTGLPHELAH
jgi:hypothetical protein